MKSWLAIYTKSRTEKKVSERLEAAGFEVYCPTRKDIRIWSDRKKTVEVPVFNSYVFVHVEESERLAVLQTPGVVRFVFWLGQPAVIREKEMEELRQFLGTYPNSFFRESTVRVGDVVGISHGQLKNNQGVVTEVRGRSVVLRLESVGFELYAEVEKSHISTTK